MTWKKKEKKKKDHDWKTVHVTSTEEAVNYKKERRLVDSCLCTSLCLLAQQTHKLWRTDSTWEHPPEGKPEVPVEHNSPIFNKDKENVKIIVSLDFTGLHPKYYLQSILENWKPF